MLTPTHISFNLIIYCLCLKLGCISFQWLDIVWFLLVEMIDLDHLWSRPIYQKMRNSFKTHLLHKQWKMLLVIAFVLLFWRNTIFLGVAIGNHLFLDWIYNKKNKL